MHYERREKRLQTDNLNLMKGASEQIFRMNGKKSFYKAFYILYKIEPKL